VGCGHRHSHYGAKNAWLPKAPVDVKPRSISVSGVPKPSYACRCGDPHPPTTAIIHARGRASGSAPSEPLDLPDVLPNGEKVRPCHTKCALPEQAPAPAPSKQEFLETHSQKRASHRLPMVREKLASCDMSKSALPVLLAAPRTGDHVAMGIATHKRKGSMEDIGNPTVARDFWEERVRSRPK